MKIQTRAVQVLLIFLAGLLLAPLCYGQKDYNWDEKEILQKYKLSNTIFLKGRDALAKGDLPKAEKELTACLEKMPEHAEAHFYLSQVFYKQGNLEKALEEVEKAKSNYHFIEKIIARQDQDRLLALREQKDSLQQSLPPLREQMAKLPPNSDQRKALESRIAGIEKSVRDIDSRLVNPLPVVEKIPGEYSYFHGNILFKMKKFPEAESQYLEAITAEPKHAQTYNNLVTLYYMAAQYDKALQYINQAEANGVQVNPELKKAVLKASEK